MRQARFPQAGWSKTYQPPQRDRLKFLDAAFWPALVAMVLITGYSLWTVFRALKGWPI